MGWERTLTQTAVLASLLFGVSPGIASASMGPDKDTSSPSAESSVAVEVINPLQEKTELEPLIVGGLSLDDFVFYYEHDFTVWEMQQFSLANGSPYLAQTYQQIRDFSSDEMLLLQRGRYFHHTLFSDIRDLSTLTDGYGKPIQNQALALMVRYDVSKEELLDRTGADDLTGAKPDINKSARLLSFGFDADAQKAYELSSGRKVLVAVTSDDKNYAYYGGNGQRMVKELRSLYGTENVGVAVVSSEDDLYALLDSSPGNDVVLITHGDEQGLGTILGYATPKCREEDEVTTADKEYAGHLHAALSPGNTFVYVMCNGKKGGIDSIAEFTASAVRDGVHVSGFEDVIYSNEVHFRLDPKNNDALIAELIKEK